MAVDPHSSYDRIVVHAITLWFHAHRSVEQATTASEIAAALTRFQVVRAALAACPIAPHEARHQQALLALIEDTMLWAEAKRDGGDVDAAQRDMRESRTIVYIEAVQLFGRAW